MSALETAQAVYAQYQQQARNLPSQVEKDFEVAIADPVCANNCHAARNGIGHTLDSAQGGKLPPIVADHDILSRVSHHHMSSIMGNKVD